MNRREAKRQACRATAKQLREWVENMPAVSADVRRLRAAYVDLAEELEARGIGVRRSPAPPPVHSDQMELFA